MYTRLIFSYKKFATNDVIPNISIIEAFKVLYSLRFLDIL